MRAATTAWTRAPLRGGCAEIRTSEYAHSSSWPQFKLTRALCVHTLHRNDECSCKTCSVTPNSHLTCNANLGKSVRKLNAHRFHNKLHFCVHKQRGVRKIQVYLVPQAMSQLRPAVADREHREGGGVWWHWIEISRIL